jgi:IS605 OrfB family transposase
MVDVASKNGAALALEDLIGIRSMYRRGNGRGEDYRFRLNSWPHWKAKQMLEYKAAWKGLATIQLTRSETYRSSSECSSCGEKLHRPAKDDAAHRRMLWCQTCKVWMDRDVNAALNLSARGRLRFDRSLPEPESRSQQADSVAMEKGEAGEAMRGNPTRTVILRVDASKLSPESHRSEILAR